MARRHRTIFSAALLLAIVAACGSRKDAEYAKRSVYDADFATVYSAALAATRDLYPKLNDNPGPGKISTAWHQVSYGGNQDDVQNTRTFGAASQGSMQPGAAQQNQPGQMGGVPTRLAYKRYFIRFDVSVIGGRPWRVKVIGKAAEWDPGAAMPVEMRGANRPPWLDGRIESLQVAIYRKIKQYAVPMKEPAETTAEDPVPKTDPTTFKTVPPGAAKTLAALSDALAKRDYDGLRPLLDDNVVWSLGGGTGVELALATWQADPGVLESMQAAIAAGCQLDATTNQVACPSGPPKVGVYQLLLADRAGTWKVTSFVRGE